MKYIGIDFGTKRIGLAHAEEGGLAFPLTTIQNGPDALSQIDELVKKDGATVVVMGESRNFKGEANPVMENIEQFKQDLEALAGVSVVYEQELFSSALAAQQFAPEEGSRKMNPEHKDLDASAAALILQSYLDKLS